MRWQKGLTIHFSRPSVICIWRSKRTEMSEDSYIVSLILPFNKFSGSDGIRTHELWDPNPRPSFFQPVLKSAAVPTGLPIRVGMAVFQKHEGNGLKSHLSLLIFLFMVVLTNSWNITFSWHSSRNTLSQLERCFYFDCVLIQFLLGDGNMAVSHTIGSNVFDILLCLGFPWLVKTLIMPPVSKVAIVSQGLYISCFIIVGTLLFAMIVVHLNNWKLDIKVGITFIAAYALFLVLAVILELNVLGKFNLPMCNIAKL